MLRTFLVLYTSLSLAALPFTAAMADAASSKAVNEAKKSAKEITDALTLPSVNESEGTLSFGAGVNGKLDADTGTIDIKALFPGDGEGYTKEKLESLFGNEGDLEAEAANREVQLSSGTSGAAQAYQMFSNSIHSSSRPDLTHDPIFKTTDLMHLFLDTKTPQCDGSGNHTPDLVTCKRPTQHPKYCVGTRELSVFHHHADAFVGARIPNHGVIRTKIDLANGTYQILPGSNILDEHTGVIPKLNLEEICTTGKAHINYAGSNAWIPPDIPGKGDPSFVLEIEQQPSCDNGLVAIVRTQDIKGGSGVIVQGVQLIWDIYGIAEDHWTWDRSDCPNDISLIQGGSCNGTVTCSDNPSNCVTVDGLTFCDADLNPPPGGLPAGCMRISVNKQCGSAGTQPDECIALEKNEKCGFIKSKCVSFAEDGKCLVVEDTYDCGIAPGPDAACQAALAMKDMVQDCEVTLTPVTKQDTVREPDYKTCEILRRLTKCSVSRDLRIVKSSNSMGFSKGCFDHDTITYRAPWTNDATLIGSNYGWIHGQTFTRNFTLSASASLSYSGSHTSASIVQQPSESNDWTTVVELTGPGVWVDVPNPDYQACVAKQATDPNVDCSGIPETVQEMQCPEGTYISGTITVSGDKLSYGEDHNPAEAENNPCLKEPDDWTDVSWTCQATVGSVGGYTIPPSMLIPLFPGDSGSCQAAGAIYDPKDYNVGIGECWKDPQGELQCLDNRNPIVYPPEITEHTTTNCTELENDPKCRYVDSRVVRRSDGYGGFDYVLEKRFDCGDDKVVEYQDHFERTYNCPSPLQCMGESCVDPVDEYSNDFSKAVVLLQAAQQAQMDMNCDEGNGDSSTTGPSNPMNCRIFSGHHMECKKAVGGWQDCCMKPNGVSLADYIELLLAIGRLDSSIMALKGIENLQGIEMVQSAIGSWETLRTPVVNAWTQVTEPFTSALNSVISNTIPNKAAKKLAMEIVDKGPIDTAINKAKTAILDGMRSWVKSNFPGAYEFLFGKAASGTGSGICGTGGCNGPANELGQQAADKAAQTATGGATQTGGLVGMLSTVLNVVMIAYAIYAILNILVKIIWKCDMEEFQLGVQRQLRNCHYVGSYCKGFLCIEKRESYCCFNSPLARIINVQAKQQLGIYDGDPENPDCSGLTITQLSSIDWNQIDLTEWLDIIKITGNYPTRQEPTQENLTGTGSFLNYDETNPRPNLEDRTRSRMEPLTIHDIRSQATKELYP